MKGGTAKLSAGAAICVAALTMGARPVRAAPARTYEVSIPAQPIEDALIDFAIQSGISLGGATTCTGTSPPLHGRFTVDEGLSRLLARSDCRLIRRGPDTVRIVRASRTTAPRLPPTHPPLAASVAAARGPLPLNALPEVIVTATKRRVSADRVPAAISSVAGEDLRRSNTVDAGDLVGRLAGITTTNLGPGRDKILIRGLSDGAFTGRTQSTVGVYLDNIPLTYNAPDPDLRLADIESVEVLRGPQGALYGAGNLNGIYRIGTRKPQLGEYGGYVRAGLSATRSGSPGGELEGAWNLPMADGRAAIRAVAYREVDGGYIDNIERAVSNVDRTVRTGGRLAARALVTPDWTLTLTGAYQSIHSNDTQYVDARYGRLHRANEVREQADNALTQAGLAVEGPTPWGALNASAAVLRHDYANRSDATLALPLFGARSASVGAYDEQFENEMFVFDAVLTSPGAGALEWLVGVSGSVSDTRTTSTVQTPPKDPAAAVTLYDERRTDRRDEVAVYGEASYRITPRLTLLSGGRLSSLRLVTRSMVAAPQTGQQRRFDGSHPFDTFTPMVALSYRARERTLLYGAASVGRRPGGFNTGGLIGIVFGSSSQTPGLQRRFAADTLLNLETGVKSTFWEGRARVQAAAFYEIWRDVQTDQYLLSGLSYTANAGEGRNEGLEAELEWRPVTGLSLQANALLDRPRLISASPAFSAGAGSALPGVPKVTGGGRISYERPLGGPLVGTASYEAEYIGLSHLTFDPSGAAKMGDYVISKLAVGVRSGAWSLTALVSNPTDAAGNTFSYGNPFVFRQTRQVTPQRPRTVSLLMTATF